MKKRVFKCYTEAGYEDDIMEDIKRKLGSTYYLSAQEYLDAYPDDADPTKYRIEVTIRRAKHGE